MSSMTPTEELDDIKKEFYVSMENYPNVYANYKMNPNLPSAADAYKNLEDKLTSVDNRMFKFQSGIEKKLDEREATVNTLTSKNAKLNAMLAKQTSSLESQDALMVQEPFGTMNMYQLPGCNAGKTNCPCVDENGNCPASCNGKCYATSNQISMVDEAKSIEKTTYLYSIMRIIYLLLGIGLISYFIYKMVGPTPSPSSADAAYDAKIRNGLQ